MISLLVLRRSRRPSKLQGEAKFEQIEPKLTGAADVQTSDASAEVMAGDVSVDSDSSKPSSEIDLSAGQEAADSKASVGAGAKGFSFFKRKKKTAASAANEAVENVAPAMPEFEEPTEAVAQRNELLGAVEQEMLATRQLYLNGHISKDVYVAETRALYERAQQSE